MPAHRRVLDDSGLRDEADAILAALADRRRTEAARIIERHCLDHLALPCSTMSPTACGAGTLTPT